MKKIGKYEIVGRLGRGGMATVYKARAPFTGRLVALKVLQPRDDIFVDLVGWPELCRVFLEEARVMGSLEHAHLAQVVDCGEHEKCPYIVLEYYSHSVGGVIAEGYQMEAPSRVLSVARTAHYLKQTLSGLVRLHAAGVAHRDIKPFNLMLTNENDVKIIDFGLSRVRGEDLLDMPGMQIGSPYYTAPEQRKNPELSDERADLYSLGVMGFRMLTGSLRCYDAGLFMPPSSLNKKVSFLWDKFLERALQQNVDNRFSSAEEMLVALGKIVGEPPQVLDVGADCRLSPEETVALRSLRQRLLLKDIAEHLQLDPLFRPEKYYAHDLVAGNDFVLTDRTAGVTWQRRGAGYTMNWQQAEEYVHHLNQQAWQGRTTWRLPTMAELVILLDPGQRQAGCYLNTLFEQTIHWLWSSDPSTKKQAWGVDFAEGYVERFDKDGAASVCAVCSER